MHNFAKEEAQSFQQVGTQIAAHIVDLASSHNSVEEAAVEDGGFLRKVQVHQLVVEEENSSFEVDSWGWVHAGIH